MQTDTKSALRSLWRILKGPTGMALFLYLVYAGSIIALAKKVGVLEEWSGSVASHVDDTPGKVSEVRARQQPLVKGVLVFDADVKKVTLPAGNAQAQFLFTFTNTSRTDVVIEQVGISCGCTTAQLPQMPWRIEPYATGRIPVTLDVQGHVGKISKTLSITTAKGTKILTVEADMIPLH